MSFDIGHKELEVYIFFGEHNSPSRAQSRLVLDVSRSNTDTHA